MRGKTFVKNESKNKNENKNKKNDLRFCHFPVWYFAGVSDAQ